MDKLTIVGVGQRPFAGNGAGDHKREGRDYCLLVHRFDYYVQVHQVQDGTWKDGRQVIVNMSMNPMLPASMHCISLATPAGYHSRRTDSLTHQFSSFSQDVISLLRSVHLSVSCLHLLVVVGCLLTTFQSDCLVLDIVFFFIA